MSKKSKTPKQKSKIISFDQKRLAKEILAKRVSDDLTLRQVGETTGLAFSALYGLEACRNIPNATTLSLVVSWLGTSVSDYFTEKFV